MSPFTICTKSVDEFVTAFTRVFRLGSSEILVTFTVESINLSK